MDQPFHWGLFLVISIFLVLFTIWFSVIKKRWHGIPRFFAFECITALVLLNLHPWFRDIFSWNQVISWILLFGPIPLAVLGFLHLESKGKPQGDFENTTKLVTTGIYHRIRHPLYASLFILSFGIGFKEITPLNFMLSFLSAAGMFFTAKIEEREMIAKFGEDYKIYMKTSWMFIPYLI